MVDLARSTTLSDKEKIDENKIKFIDNLWVVGEKKKKNICHINMMVIISLRHGKSYVDIVNGEKADKINKLTLEDFKHLGIRELLTMQRQVGLEV